MNVLPFDRDALLSLLAHYNDAVWPWQVLWVALAFAALGLLHPATRGALKTRGVAAILAALWAWMGVVFHFVFFSTIQPAAWLFGAVSLLQAAALAWYGVAHDGFGAKPSPLASPVRAPRGFEPNGKAASTQAPPPRAPWRTGAAWTLIGYALLAYPLLGWEQGLRFPAVPTFSMPGPTTIYSVGLMLLAGPSVPRVLFIVPVLWALVGSMAAMTLGLTQDLMLWLAGIAAVWAIGAPAPVAPQLGTDAS
jgi:hypothetical protein